MLLMGAEKALKKNALDIRIDLMQPSASFA